ncbi:hypothetical protein ERJ75_000534300 [Trypanosoma vivax]|nr:hypothetical protein TRVL_04256 [Trypanosoma vivax]KAH8615921.1 hypothetical protein ERJ75_000534300 [Trypanosoma vivax]
MTTQSRQHPPPPCLDTDLELAKLLTTLRPILQGEEVVHLWNLINFGCVMVLLRDISQLGEERNPVHTERSQAPVLVSSFVLDTLRAPSDHPTLLLYLLPPTMISSLRMPWCYCLSSLMLDEVRSGQNSTIGIVRCVSNDEIIRQLLLLLQALPCSTEAREIRDTVYDLLTVLHQQRSEVDDCKVNAQDKHSVACFVEEALLSFGVERLFGAHCLHSSSCRGLFLQLCTSVLFRHRALANHPVAYREAMKFISECCSSDPGVNCVAQWASEENMLDGPGAIGS